MNNVGIIGTLASGRGIVDVEAIGDGVVENGKQVDGGMGGRPRCSGNKPGTNRTTVCVINDLFYVDISF